MANLSQELLNRRRNPKLVLLWICLLIGLVACFVGGAMALIYFTGRRMAKVHGPMMDAAMEIKLETATVHLWFEELISGDQEVTIDQVVRHIDQADWYANAMLKGGQNPEGKYVALTDPDMREDVRQVQEKLVEFRAVTLERWEAKDKAGIGSEIDQRYDALFSDLQTLADKVETDVKVLIDQNLYRFSAQQMALVIICLIVTFTVSVSFGRFVLRQIKDEQKLIALNQQLDTSNQQLVANEQQLRAANQQLMSSEQQLRASNQQLIANEKRLRQSQRELREQRDRAQKYLDVAGVMFVVLNSDGDVTLVNPKGCGVLACSRDEVIGKNWFDNFLPKSLSKPVKDVFLELMDGKLEPVEYYENPVVTKDGRERIIAWHNTILRDEQDRITGTLSSGTDITERKKAEEELRESRGKLDAMLESIADQISMVDRELNIIWANKSCEEVFGTGIVGKKCYEVFHDRSNPCGRDNCMAVRAFEDGQIHSHETQVTDKDGRLRYQHTTASVAFRDEDGKPTAVIEVSRDITERKVAEEALAESEAKYRTLVEQIPSVTYVASIDEVNSTLYISPQIERMLGFEPEKWLKESDLWARQMHPDDHQRVLDELKESRQADEKFVSEYRMYAKDKRIVWIHDEAAVAKDQIGKALFVQGIMSDITERKRAENELRNAKEFVDNAINAQTDTFFVFNPKTGKTIKWNENFSRISGYTDEEISGIKAPDSYYDQDDLEKAKEALRDLEETGSATVELSLITKKGERIPFEYKVSLIEITCGENIAISIGRDITERKQAEDALRESEEKFRTLAEQSPNMIFINKKGRIVYANKKCEEIMGYSREDFYSPDFDFFNLIVPESRDQIAFNFREHMSGKEVPMYEYSLLTKDGQWIGAILTSKLITYEGEDAILGTVTDITERKRVEEKLKQYAFMVESAHDVIFFKDLEGRYVIANQKTLEAFGLSREQIIGKTDYELMADKGQAKQNFKDDQLVFKTRQLQRITKHMTDADGKERWFQAIKVPQFNDKGKVVGLVGIARDITEQREAERQAQEHQAQLLHISRLSTVGEMASGLAHELNQPLSAIMSYANASLRSVKSENADIEKISENLELVALQSKRAGEIIRRIRGFVRKQKPNREKVDANRLVKEVVSFVEGDIRSNKVDLKLSLAGKISKVNADSIQIEQVLLNLIRNAIEAMAESQINQRTLTIHTSATESESIELTVSDSGHGLDDEIVEQVFEPFFTTKADGLGIGLSISRSIVEAHGGNLWAESNAQGGSTFKFTLPITK